MIDVLMLLGNNRKRFNIYWIVIDLISFGTLDEIKGVNLNGGWDQGKDETHRLLSNIRSSQKQFYLRC